MKKTISLNKAIAAIVATNLIIIMVFSLIFLSYSKRTHVVSDEDYNFLKQYGQMIEVRDLLNKYYVDKIDQNAMVEGAIKGMASADTDKYTYFMNKKEYDELMVQTEGSYAGLGMYLDDKDGKIVVVAPIEDSPAEKAGIKSGDIILKVNGQDVTANDMDKAIAMMKGKEGVKVQLTIDRTGTGNIQYNLTTAKIVFKTVKSQMLSGNIGYIRITMFDENTADDFNKALDGLLKQNMKGLIIDLRDNPGGLLDQVSKIADRLLGKGTIVYTIDNQGKKDVITSDANKINVPLALLVNGGSASASEILSGAVRDFKAGTLIGTKTYGKGLVQTIIPLENGTGLKVTIARYYTPSGECIQGIGITPNIVIDLPEKDKNKVDLPMSEDVQLQKAIEVIKSKM